MTKPIASDGTAQPVPDPPATDPDRPTPLPDGVTEPEATAGEPVPDSIVTRPTGELPVPDATDKS